MLGQGLEFATTVSDLPWEREKRQLWPHVWQMACRHEEIPEIGGYVEYRLLDKSVFERSLFEIWSPHCQKCVSKRLMAVEGGSCAEPGHVLAQQRELLGNVEVVGHGIERFVVWRAGVQRAQ